MFYKEMHPCGNLNEVCVFSTMDGGTQHVTREEKAERGIYREREREKEDIERDQRLTH